MITLTEIEKYLNYKFNSDWENTKEYLDFQSKYISYLRYIFNKQKYRIIKINKNHFEFSLFVFANNKLVYFSISDVRYYKNEWYNNILIRTVNSENDYIGNKNYYTNLKSLISNIEFITKEN